MRQPVAVATAATWLNLSELKDAGIIRSTISNPPKIMLFFNFKTYFHAWKKEEKKEEKIKCILDTEILFCNDLQVQVQCIVLSLRACSDHKRFLPKHNSMLHAYENTSVKCSRKRKESNITVISASPTVRPSAFVRKPCRPPTSGYWGIMGKRITFIIIWTKSKTNLNSTVLYISCLGIVS